jgi:hypothetical protein
VAGAAAAASAVIRLATVTLVRNLYARIALLRVPHRARTMLMPPASVPGATVTTPYGKRRDAASLRSDID